MPCCDTHLHTTFCGEEQDTFSWQGKQLPQWQSGHHLALCRPFPSHGPWCLGIDLCSLQLCPVWNMDAPPHPQQQKGKGLVWHPRSWAGNTGEVGPVTTKPERHQLHFPQNCLFRGAPCWQGAPEAPGSHWALSQAPLLGSNTLLAGQTLCVSDLGVVCPSFSLIVPSSSAAQEQPTWPEGGWHLWAATLHTTGCCFEGQHPCAFQYHPQH